MISLSPAVLRAVLRQREMTVSKLAELSHNKQQTLSHLTQGYGWKRCRRTRVQAIARVLKVSVSLLEGQDFAIPRGKQIGFEFLYSADTIIAARHFLERCQHAVVRDIAQAGLETKPESMDGFVAESYLSDFMQELLSIGFWRLKLLTWNRRRHPRQTYTEPLAADPSSFLTRPVEDRDHEEATLSLIRGLEHILAPWFDGDARLHYRALKDLVNEPVGDAPDLTSPLSIIPRPDETPRAGE